jgi:IS30 family transposase
MKTMKYTEDQMAFALKQPETEEQVQRSVDRLNHRPRKVLGYSSPHEVFFSKKVSYTKSSLAVALQS